MYNKNNIFAKIIRGELDCTKVYEDNDILAFNDISPSAPVHVLVIPKHEYISFDDFVLNYHDVNGFFKVIRKIAHNLGLEDSGYRLVTNHGPDSGQIVPHFHIHILGGKKLGEIG
jgi:diadenosine tetraphosphate (Ap4A) HIT family hydrolase